MRLFGTDGIRGVVGQKLTEDLAYKIGRAFGIVLRESGAQSGAPKVLLGRDTRVSGPMLERAVSRGLNSAGVDVLSAGIIPTPAHNYLTKILPVAGGVMITASHNPAEHNGIKFCGAEGGKLAAHVQQKIEDIVFDLGQCSGVIGEGKCEQDTSLGALWVDYILAELGEPNLRGMRVALDTANGAGYALIPQAFERAGAIVLATNTESDGSHINKDCGSVNVDKFVPFCLQNHADIGFSFDGDADRIMVVSRDGKIYDGTDLMFIFGTNYAQNGKLVGDTVVSTIVTNSGLESSLAAQGIKLVRTAVGGQYIQREMDAHGYLLGGEENGHMMLGDIGEGSDGMCIGLNLAKIMRETAEDLPALTAGLKRSLMAKSDLHVTEDQKAAVDNGALADLVDELSARLAGRGRIVLRTSGTENVVRILVEGEDQTLLDEINQRLAAATMKL